MSKKYCEIHHLYYDGDICPFCQKEKYERMSHAYHTTQNKENSKKSNERFEITDDVINKLRDHFKK